MTPSIRTSQDKKLIGMKASMSLITDKTPELWQRFMPRRKEIEKVTGTDLILMQVYPSLAYFQQFNPANLFDKWAAVEVQNFEKIPDGMESFTLPAGKYAMFIHRGGPPAAQKTYQYIFQEWLPGSQYVLDQRPHFDVLGEKYKNAHPDSEEEIWIPIADKR